MSTDAQPVASSATPVYAGDAGTNASATQSLAELSRSERQEWLMTGEMPGRKLSETPAAESSPAEPVEQAASTDAPTEPASEPGKPIKANADTRVRELLAERHALRERLAALERASQPAPDARPAAPSAAPQAGEQTFPDFAQWAEAHPESSYEAYLDDRADWRADRRIQQQQAQERQAKDAAVRVERQTKFNAAVGVKDEAWWSGIRPEIAALRPIDQLAPGETPTAVNVLGQEIYTSPIAPLLMEHFSAHPEEFHELAALPDYAAIVRRIGKLEARLETATGGEPTPAPKTVSSAPPPPHLVGRRTAPVDDMDAAIAGGNFRAYKQLADRQQWGAGKG